MGRIVALTGGIGGAKLAFGLSRVLDPDQFDVVVNTGDDFEHLALSVSPDVDTLLYTLAGVNNRTQGWGREDETWSFMSALEQIGAATWFQLGDKDLALIVYRTHALRQGRTLSDITFEIAERLGVSVRVIPMSDQRVETRIISDQGELAFQDYFVRQRCMPSVSSIEYVGADIARPADAFRELLDSDDVDAFVICPSNPYLSIDPILSIPGVSDALRNHRASVIAVSPVVGGDSLKGPLAKIMTELGIERSVTSIARHYGGLLDVLVIDERDERHAADIRSLGVDVAMADVVMDSDAERVRLADFVATLCWRP